MCPSALPSLAGSGTPRRRATTLDRVRVRAWIQRTESGEEPLDAFWAVASDPRTGLQRYRGTTARPADITLQKKLAALLERAAPELLMRAKDIANARLAALTDNATEVVSEVLAGSFSDTRKARVMLDAARLVLAAFGIREHAPASVQSNVVVSLGDGLRALRHVDVEGDTIDATAEVQDAEGHDDRSA